MHRRVRIGARSAQGESYERIEGTGWLRLRGGEHERRLQIPARSPSPVARLMRIARRTSLLTLLLFCPAGSVHSQVPATWVPGSVESRSHDYDLVHQRIEIRDLSWDSTSLN